MLDQGQLGVAIPSALRRELRNLDFGKRRHDDWEVVEALVQTCQFGLCRFGTLIWSVRIEEIQWFDDDNIVRLSDN